MLKFMKMLNNVSRSQAIYRQNRILAKDLQSGHYAFLLTICHLPGRSQEEIARELCINKSTAARNINYLEEAGYIYREVLENNKRQFSVHPTDKALCILPEIQKTSREWMDILSKGISQNDLDIFVSVLERMETRAREITEIQEANK